MFVGTSEIFVALRLKDQLPEVPPDRPQLITGFDPENLVIHLRHRPEEPEETSEYSCPDPFPVKTYDESEEQRSIMLEIHEESEQVLFSGTVDVAANTAPYDGSGLDVGIYDAQQYTFEVTGADGGSLPETFTAKCGPGFVFVTETGELGLRDDELDHLPES